MISFTILIHTFFFISKEYLTNSWNPLKTHHKHGKNLCLFILLLTSVFKTIAFMIISARPTGKRNLLLRGGISASELSKHSYSVVVCLWTVCNMKKFFKYKQKLMPGVSLRPSPLVCACVRVCEYSTLNHMLSGCCRAGLRL